MICTSANIGKELMGSGNLMKIRNYTFASVFCVSNFRLKDSVRVVANMHIEKGTRSKHTTIHIQVSVINYCFD